MLGRFRFFFLEKNGILEHPNTQVRLWLLNVCNNIPGECCAMVNFLTVFVGCWSVGFLEYQFNTRNYILHKSCYAINPNEQEGRQQKGSKLRICTTSLVPPKEGRKECIRLSEMVVKICSVLSSLMGKCARTIAILPAKPNISPSPLKILCFVSETNQMASSHSKKIANNIYFDLWYLYIIEV